MIDREDIFLGPMRPHGVCVYTLVDAHSLSCLPLSPTASQLISHEVDHARPTSPAGHVNTSATSDPARRIMRRARYRTREKERMHVCGDDRVAR